MKDRIGLFVSFPVRHNTSLAFRNCSSHRIKLSFLTIHHFLPNPVRILPILTVNGLQLLNVNAEVCQDFAENEEMWKYSNATLHSEHFAKLKVFVLFVDFVKFSKINDSNDR